MRSPSEPSTLKMMAENIWNVKPPTLPDPASATPGQGPELLVPISEALTSTRLKFTGLGVRHLDINKELKAHMEYNALVYNWVMSAVSLAALPENERMDTAVPIPSNFREDLGAGPDAVIYVVRASPGHFKVMT